MRGWLKVVVLAAGTFVALPILFPPPVPTHAELLSAEQEIVAAGHAAWVSLPAGVKEPLTSTDAWDALSSEQRHAVAKAVDSSGTNSIGLVGARPVFDFGSRDAGDSDDE